MKKAAAVLFLAGLAGLPFACGGKVGEALRPNDPTATNAMSTDGKCTSGSTSQPLVIDLSSAERTDLELAMRKGIMVVQYDCKALRLVKGCQLEGSYAFAAVVPKEDLVTIKNADELLANMPISGAKFEAEIRAGSSIDLVLVTIGQRGATLMSATKNELKGGSECKDATHFVRAAYVGGFSMTKNTMGKAKVGAEGFGGAANAQSGSDKMAAAHDGDLDVCRQSSSESQKPPEKCQSPLRIEIVPITSDRVIADEHLHAHIASSAAVAASVSAAASASGSAVAGMKDAPPNVAGCAPPWVWTGTKCAKQEDVAAHQCDPKDEADCTKQCNAGHAGSCYALGQLSWKDPKKQVDLYDKACKGREARGCYSHASMLLSLRMGSKDDAEKAQMLAAAQKDADAACGFGDGWSCYAVSSWYSSGFTFPKDPVKGGQLLKRSCDLGYSIGCTQLATYLIAGDKGLAKDTAQASTLLSRACESGSVWPCERLGQAYQKGELGGKDAVKAITAYSKACDLGGARACAYAGQIYKAGEGVTPDAAKAKEFYEKGCTPKLPGWDACLALGEALEKTDKQKAAEAYARGCMLGGCERAAAIYEKGDGAMKADPQKAFELYKRACGMSTDLSACDKAGQILEKTDKDKAKQHYLDVCTSRWDQPSCDTAKKMGATIPDTVKARPRPPKKP